MRIKRYSESAKYYMMLMLGLFMLITSCQKEEIENSSDSEGALSLDMIQIDNNGFNITKAADNNLKTTFKAGDVILMYYSFTSQSATESSDKVYAKMNSDNSTWTFYSDLELTTPSNPAPQAAGESWDNVSLLFVVHPENIVTVGEQLVYGGERFDTVNGTTKFYDILQATKASKTSSLEAGEYYVEKAKGFNRGKITVNLAHGNSLLKLDPNNIKVKGEGYDGISSLIAKTVYNANTYDVSFDKVGNVWQALVPLSLKSITATLSNSTDASDAVNETIDREVKLNANTIYPLSIVINYAVPEADIYTEAKYLKWDADPNADSYDFGYAGDARYSCKDCPSEDQIQMYLGAGVYWDAGTNVDENRQTYKVVLGGTNDKFHSGLWIKKKEHITGFAEKTAPKLDTATPTLGRPTDIDNYFFLPAAGGKNIDAEGFLPVGSNGSYWLNYGFSSDMGNYASSFTFTKDKATINNYYYESLLIPMPLR